MSSLPTRAVAPPVAERPLGCAVVLPEYTVHIPFAALTLEGFRRWGMSDEFPERGRISFLDQELHIDMSPEELENHNKVKVEITYALVGLNKKRKLGEFYGDRSLVTNVEANLSTEPDAAFVSWKSLETGRVRLVQREDVEGEYLEIEGTPDWVLEIVSKSSVRKDRRMLRELYYRAGVPEYWLIDARGEAIEFAILLRGETEYESAVGRGGWRRSSVFRSDFRLTRRRNRLGYWDYTMQAKSRR